METAAKYQNLLRSSDSSIIEQFQKVAPVNIVGIAEAFGLKVYEDDFPNGISGKILKDLKYGGKSGYSIIINCHEPLPRKRFTIAHEISHFLLHKDRIGDGLVDDALYRSGLTTLAEVRANKLAADILMPFNLIDEVLKKGATNLNQLAAALEVSPQAMRVRLEIPS